MAISEPRPAHVWLSALKTAQQEASNKVKVTIAEIIERLNVAADTRASSTGTEYTHGALCASSRRWSPCLKHNSSTLDTVFCK
jgi:hypothetical protein